MESPPSWLLEHLPLNVRLLPSSDGPSAKPKHVDARCHRPHITLTWAQSLDFKIAGPGGARVILSGPESMEMTHWSVLTLLKGAFADVGLDRMRAMHDSILVGINTIILDDPRLQGKSSNISYLNSMIVYIGVFTDRLGQPYYLPPLRPVLRTLNR